MKDSQSYFKPVKILSAKEYFSWLSQRPEEVKGYGRDISRTVKVKKRTRTGGKGWCFTPLPLPSSLFFSSSINLRPWQFYIEKGPSTVGRGNNTFLPPRNYLILPPSSTLVPRNTCQSFLSLYLRRPIIFYTYNINSEPLFVQWRNFRGQIMTSLLRTL